TGDPEQVEEERRLFYVALTRARDELHVYFPLRSHRSTRGLEHHHWYAQLTRFLPDEVRGRFHRRATYQAPQDRSPVIALEGSGKTQPVDAPLGGLCAD